MLFEASTKFRHFENSSPISLVLFSRSVVDEEGTFVKARAEEVHLVIEFFTRRWSAYSFHAYFPARVHVQDVPITCVHGTFSECTRGQRVWPVVSPMQRCTRAEIQCRSMHARVWQHDNDIPRVCSLLGTQFLALLLFPFHLRFSFQQRSVKTWKVTLESTPGSSSVETKVRVNFPWFKGICALCRVSSSWRSVEFIVLCFLPRMLDRPFCLR